MLARAFSGLAVATPAPARRNPSLASTSAVRGPAVLTSSRTASAPAARGSVVVFAKQNALQRQRLAEKQRVYNKARKSAVATRIKKVCSGVEKAEEKMRKERERAAAGSDNGDDGPACPHAFGPSIARASIDSKCQWSHETTMRALAGE